MSIAANSIGNGIVVFLANFGLRYSLLVHKMMIEIIEITIAAIFEFVICLMISIIV